MNLIFYRKAMVVHLGEDLRQLQDHSFCKVSAHQPWSRRSKLSADYMRLRMYLKERSAEHQLLLGIAERPDSALTLAYTPGGEIVGQVTLAPADTWWQGVANT